MIFRLAFFILVKNIYFGGFTIGDNGFEKYFLRILDKGDQIDVTVDINDKYLLVWIFGFVLVFNYG